MQITQNNFYRIISSRHYNYVLTRISQNASYKWLFDKSSLELSRQLDATEKGLQHIFTFISNTVRIISAMSFSIIIASWSCKWCIFIFGVCIIALYSTIKKKNLFQAYTTQRNRFNLTNQQNSLIISDNLSILLDSILHNNFNKIIKNILSFNDAIKDEQIKLYQYEDQTYTRVGLFIITGFILILTIISSSMNLSFDQFTLFFISMLLTYKCINYSINELCNMYANIRQTQIDFDNIESIWKNTKTQRTVYDDMSDSIELQAIDFTLVEAYYKYHLSVKELNELAIYKSYIVLNEEFTIYLDSYIDQLTKSYYPDINKTDMINLTAYKNFVNLDYIKKESFNKYIYENNYDIFNIKEHDIFTQYNDTHQIIKNDPTFSIQMHYLHFYYTKNIYDTFTSIKFMNNEPLTIQSNSHILISGITGSGKTTLLKIIRGIIPLTSVDTYTNNPVNSMKLFLNTSEFSNKNINWTNLSQAVSYCHQNTISFTGGTIYQILSDDYISTDIDVQQTNEETKLLMHRALFIACVNPEFRNLTFKCTKDTISSGQQQRLTLAKNLYRIFIQNKHIIIFDEIDANLDINTAEKIIINLKLAFKEKMLFVVLHSEELKKLFNTQIEILDGNIFMIN